MSYRSPMWSPRWSKVKEVIPSLVTGFGVWGGVGAHWIDHLGNPQEHYEATAIDLLEWFEARLGNWPAKAPTAPVAEPERTNFEKQQLRRLQELYDAQRRYNNEKYRPKFAPPSERLEEQVKPKTPVNPYKRKFG